MDSITFYIICLIAIIVGIYLVKRFVSCLVRSAVTIALILLLGYLYFMYFK